MKYMKSFEWVLANLQSPNVRVMDCRFQLNNPEAGEEAYVESHLPNACYINLDRDLSSKVHEHGGRHPLPDIETFVQKLSQLGIDETVTVLAYDDQNGAMASRLWWLLQYVGHQNVYVMNGNFSQWVEEGLPVDRKVPVITPKEFHLSLKDEMLATVHDVKKKLHDPDTIIVDSREPNRHLGIEEPIDKKAGHIPGSVNYFWLESLKDGKWQEKEELQERFKNIPKDKEVIVYCGSGVTACPNVLSLKEAGYSKIKLYVGSWSDWISYPQNPISTKKPLS